MSRSLLRPSGPAPPLPAAETLVVRGGGPPLVCRVRRGPRRRSVALRLEGAAVVLAVPETMSRRALERFADERAGWLRRNAALLLEAPRARDLAFADGETLHLRGEPVGLRVTVDRLRRRTAVAAAPGALTVVLPPGLDAASPAVRRDAIRQAVVGHARGLATASLPDRVAVFAERLGRRPAGVLVRDQKRRWGSCDSKGVVRLNWRLALLPSDLADYVCAHEAAHLAVMDHSARFWARVALVMPDWRERRTRLRRDAPFYLFSDAPPG